MKLIKPKFWDAQKISIWSIILYPLTLLFILVTLLKKRIQKEKKFPIPVICVGNIYLGGTGKTPLASELFKIIKLNGKNPGFIKKNYNYLYDEIQMLEKIGKIFSNKYRNNAINSLILSGHDVAILDDGFQDFSIKKSFSILCFNSKQLIGNGLVIPSGPLRESINSIKRADCIFINGDRNINFESKIFEINEKIKIFYSKYKINNLDTLKNKKVIAFAGIGNPSNFFELLKENNFDVIESFSYPDHHAYSEKDYDFLLKKKERDLSIITTEKDYLRLSEKFKNKIEYVKLDLEIENKNKFINIIKRKI